MATKRATRRKTTTRARATAATTAEPATITPIKAETRTGIMAVLRKLAKDHPAWGDVYRPMTPAERKQLVGELGRTFEHSIEATA